MKKIAAVFLALALGTAGATAATKARKPAAPAEPTELTGTVVRIVDGDTLWLKTAADGEPVVIRLEGIDAPESCQAGGAEATQALNALALNRSVTVRVAAKDDHGRTVAKVFDGDKDVGDRMVRDGHAWSMRYKYDRGPYVAEERMAIALKRGVHAEDGAVMPRDFRQRNGPCEGAKPPAAAAAPSPSAVKVAAASGSAYRCDQRTYCSQMTSCEEATWFLQHCPGVKMDGNRDGVPCEQQWCGRR
jgi:endonuclease YncB( thermonuclease family)